MLKKHLLILMTMVAVAAASPAAATATTAVPDLPAGVHQAYIADGDGIPEFGQTALLGFMTMSMSIGLNITCAMDMRMEFYDDGTTWIPSFDAYQCTTTVPGCTATIKQGLGSWGDRFGYDTSSGSFKDYINVALDVTLHYPGCPVSGTFTETGLLSPTFSMSGGSATLTFDGSSSGTVSSALGTASFNGSLLSAWGIGSGTQLVF